MKKKFTIRLLLAALFVLLTVPVCGHEVNIKVDERLKSMSSKELVYLGCENMNRNMPDNALLYFTIVANRRYGKTAERDSVEIESYANALLFIGQLYSHYYHNYQLAYKFFIEGENYAKKHNFKLLLPMIHNNLAGLLLEEGRANNNGNGLDILQAFRRAFHEALEYGYNIDGLHAIVMNMTSTAMEWHLVDSIKSEIDQYLFCCPSDSVFSFGRFFCQAVIENGCNNNYEKARLLLEDAKAHVHRIGLNATIDSVIIYRTMFQMMFERGCHSEAINLMDTIVPLCRRGECHSELIDIYRCLSDYYQEKGDEMSAKKYDYLFLKDKDVLVDKQKLAEVGHMKFLLEINKLNEEAREQANRERLKTYMMYWVGFVALMLMGMLVWIFRKYQQTQEKNLQLYQKNIELLAAHAEEVKRLEQEVAESREKPKAKYEKSPLDEEGKQDLMHRVFLILEKSEEVFKPNFTLDRLAELVDANPTYVSYVINEKRQCNFNVLLNEYRIKEACRRLNDREHYGHLTIEGVAASVGIKSRTNFATNFKKFTGLTPSEYQRMAARNAADNVNDSNKLSV